ncbi:MAG: biotin carboxyl carrier domain-containing protein [Chloroflexi bacterium]|nr:biotin carboxyl carrier domain-containing protein [Chloroflexota bacterium]
MTVDIRSPLPGVFYRRPSPESEPFVDVGSAVAPDTVVAIVEVMKQFFEVPAGTTGKISAVAVADAEMVDAGQVLFTVLP